MSSTRIKGGFWRQKADVVARQMLPYQWKALNDQIEGAEPSHALENFRIVAGEAQGSFVGTIFQDSDVAKWIEAASYALADRRDPDLEALVDEAIRLVGKAQGDDGYINTWFTLVGPDKRWTDLAWGHELYCGGHLIEAAVAHHQATGSTKFLDIMKRYADGLFPVFGPGGLHAQDACGHPEIELALHRLADATGDPKYRDLAVHFVEVRGQHPEKFLNKKPLGFDIPPGPWFQPDYFQGHSPVREQHHADGHAVRAMYLYTAMAKQVAHAADATMLKALQTLWASVTGRRMYLTGGLGSHALAERFSIDYDLPSDTAYTETCASIGLMFWARAMLDVDPQARYADELERALFNGALSGMALDGQRFFYVNPLEVVPKVARYRQDLSHVKTERVAWFGCSCCPPNIARTVGSVADLAWGILGDRIFVHQFVDSEARYSLPGGELTLSLTTKYPWEGRIAVTVATKTPQRFALSLRVPAWCTSYAVRMGGKTLDRTKAGDGYLTLDRDWNDDDTVELELAMPVRVLAPHSRIAELAGRVAFARGPLVFCAEETDNGQDLHNLSVEAADSPQATFDSDLMGGSYRIRVPGRRRNHQNQALYPTWDVSDLGDKVEVTLVPYHQWGNRRPGQEMRVWLRASQG